MELARRTLAAAGPDDHVVVGIATDDLPEGRPATLAQIVDAYLSQLQQVEGAGGTSVLMASRHLAQAATSPDDYVEVYDRVLSAARRPITLHWLGAAFDPQLKGYWGHDDIDAAADTVIDIISAHSDAIDGIKVSLLDAAAETALRRRLPAGVRCYTGDDFSYPELIAGDEHGYSDALLGAFGTIPRFASAALAALDAGDVARFREILDPTVSLSRLVFEAPTHYYKVGVTWLAYLDGAQDHFRMLDGFETGRSLTHLGSLVDAAGRIGLFSDPELTAERATRYFANHGM